MTIELTIAIGFAALFFGVILGRAMRPPRGEETNDDGCVFHKWPRRWGEPFDSSTVRSHGSFGETRKHDIVVQDRECERCGRVQSRFIRDGRV